jgi:hypothetical protein
VAYKDPEYKNKWNAANKAKRRKYSRDWYKRNKKKAYAATRAWVKKNPEKVREAQKNFRHNLRKRVLEKLGAKCNNPACQWLNADGSRGCIDARCLQVDHVLGGGTQENEALNSRNQFYYKVLEDSTGAYQLLCANCNWIKRHTNRECN